MFYLAHRVNRRARRLHDPKPNTIAGTAEEAARWYVLLFGATLLGKWVDVYRSEDDLRQGRPPILTTQIKEYRRPRLYC